VASGGTQVLNPDVVEAFALGPDTITSLATAAGASLAARQREWVDAGRPPLELAGRIAILVDDGLATGASMRAALTAARTQRPARLVAAVPVGAAPTCSELRAFADEVVCAATPEPFTAVGRWYDDFSPTTDEEVRRLLRHAPPPAGEETGA
jgi:predicted phosphoribosyltransferase